MNYDEIAHSALERARLRCSKSSTPDEVWEISVDEIAAALRDAANRAAWDGYAHGVQLALHRVESKYGPRPTTENQP